MHVDYSVDVKTVAAARSGDQQALEELVGKCLPLVYNIIGRALDGAFDVDDVVQDTMLQVVDSLDQLREPESFRSWMVAIAIQKVRDRWRNQQKRTVLGELDEVYGTADPGADFVDLTILRLGLSEQRREVAEATRWLEPDERELLSLWWLESAGELTRQELATALGLTPSHAAVRVQRMRARLDTARTVVRALRSSPPCADLVMLTVAWDGAPSALWRKRLGRHVRECPVCSQHQRELMPAEALLAGMALVPLPATLAARSLFHGAATHAATASGSTHTASAVSRRAAHLGHYLAAKPAAALTAGALVLGGGAAIGLGLDHRAGSPSTAAAPANKSPSSAATPTSPSSAPIPPSVTASSESQQPAALYGQTVDQLDSPPGRDTKPGTLPTRPQGDPLTISGKYAKPE